MAVPHSSTDAKVRLSQLKAQRQVRAYRPWRRFHPLQRATCPGTGSWEGN